MYYAVWECSAKEVRGCSGELLRELEGMSGLHAMIRSVHTGPGGG